MNTSLLPTNDYAFPTILVTFAEDSSEMVGKNADSYSIPEYTILLSNPSNSDRWFMLEKPLSIPRGLEDSAI